MRLAVFAAAVAATLALSAAAAPSGEAALAETSDPARHCGRLAAYRPDPHRVGPPVSAEAFDAEAAQSACTAALAAAPADAALRFHLARAHWRLDDVETAHLLLEQAADMGHAGAYYVLGRLFHEGAHVRRDHPVALRHYLEAARRGAMAGVAGALALYEDPESPSHDPAKAQVLGRNPAALWMRHRQAETW